MKTIKDSKPIEYEEFITLIDLLPKLRNLHNNGQFKEADRLRESLNEKGMSIGFLPNGKIKYQCKVRQDGKIQIYGQELI